MKEADTPYLIRARLMRRSPGGWARRAGYPAGELDGEAEFLQLTRQAAGLVLLVLAGGEVVLAEVGECLTGGEQVPDHVEEAVRDRNGGLVRAPAAGCSLFRLKRS
jgi:hypothetical protein